MSAIAMKTVMDAITSTLTSGGRDETMYPYPAEAIDTPCVIVGFPTRIDYDVVFARGSDKAIFPVWFVVSRSDPKTARDALSDIIAGATSVKAILDGTLGSVVQVAEVTDCQPDFIEVAGVPHAAARFTLEVLS